MNFKQKYKPQKFSDLVFASTIAANRLSGYFAGNRDGRILLNGPYGSGKTSAARVLVGTRVGPHNVDWLCCHPQAGADNLVTKFTYMVNNALHFTDLAGKPYIFIDEVDQLSAKSQLQLRYAVDALVSTILCFRHEQCALD